MTTNLEEPMRETQKPEAVQALPAAWCGLHGVYDVCPDGTIENRSKTEE